MYTAYWLRKYITANMQLMCTCSPMIHTIVLCGWPWNCDSIQSRCLQDRKLTLQTTLPRNKFLPPTTHLQDCWPGYLLASETLWLCFIYTGSYSESWELSQAQYAPLKKRLLKKPHQAPGCILGQAFWMWLMDCIKFSDAVILPHSILSSLGKTTMSISIRPRARVWCQGYSSNRELVVPKMRSSYLELLPYSKVPVLASVSHSPPPDVHLLQR